MEYSISARISNRHVHLTKELYDLLFDVEMTKKNDLSQVGEFASNQVLTIKNVMIPPRFHLPHFS